MKEIKLVDVTKKYGDVTVIDNINLTIRGGEKLILLGPSGCGKSTTLRMIAGLEEITSGQLFLDGKDMTYVASGKRDVAMVFQNYALYPNMTVSDNITFSLRANKVNKQEIQRRLDKALEMLDLVKYKDRLPKDLSGGQRQRVALARAVVKRSQYFLLDEPLSNLDVTLRHSARNQLVDIHEEYQQTMVYVTHDQVEAMTIGDRIVLMKDGQIMMVGTPEEVYSKPTNVFTASFIGSPKMNLQPVHFDDGKLYIGSQEVSINSDWQDYLTSLNQSEFILGIRPEHLSISPDDTENSFSGVVRYTENLGPNYGITVQTRSTEWIVLSTRRDWEIGDTAHVSIDASKIHVFDPQTEYSLGYPQ